MMSKSMDRCAATEEVTLLPPEEPLDWDNIQGDDSFTKMMFSD
nr:hypothetical protein [Pectobacterium versatile]